MRTLIVIALICAVVGLFVGLAVQMLVMAGRHHPMVFFITGPISIVCHSVPPILLSIVLLNRQGS